MRHSRCTTVSQPITASRCVRHRSQSTMLGHITVVTAATMCRYPAMDMDMDIVLAIRQFTIAGKSNYPKNARVMRVFCADMRKRKARWLLPPGFDPVPLDGSGRRAFWAARRNDQPLHGFPENVIGLIRT